MWKQFKRLAWTLEHNVPLSRSCTPFLVLGTTLAAILTTNDTSLVHTEAKSTSSNLSSLKDPIIHEETVSKPRTRRPLLKARNRYKAKLEEVDLMKAYLREYQETNASIDSLATRFELYASKMNGSQRLMTCTDFIQSLILPRFHTKSPHPDMEYTCDFIGNKEGLISYEECFILLHLLQIPKEHFQVAFHMFDVDGDGTVDKNEFTHVMDNLLHTITSEETKLPLEQVLSRLLTHLFGKNGKKRINCKEIEKVLDHIRTLLIQAEFDLYAIPHPTHKRVMSVHDFAITLVSGMESERLPIYIERIEALNQSNELVTWEEFYQFHFYIQNHLSDIQLAFELIGNEEITISDFIRAAFIVTGIELSVPVVTLAFRVFDANGNGTLDQSEVMRVLEKRNHVDIYSTHRSESRFTRLWKCTTQTTKR